MTQNLMRLIPAEGVQADRKNGRMATGIATAAFQLADSFGQPCDLVLIAVPAGQGARVLAGQTVRSEA